MPKIGDKVYILVNFNGEPAIAEVKIQGLKINDDGVYQFYCVNSRLAKWEWETKVYFSLNELLANLGAYVIK